MTRDAQRAESRMEKACKRSEKLSEPFAPVIIHRAGRFHALSEEKPRAISLVVETTSLSRLCACAYAHALARRRYRGPIEL
jgi:hypothetical protein